MPWSRTRLGTQRKGAQHAGPAHQLPVPELADGIRSATYLDVCPPSLRSDGEPGWQRIQQLRPVAGEPAAGERLPGVFTALPYPQTIHLTLGTIFHEAPGVFETAIAGLRELPFNLVVTTGPGADPARFGPQPPHVLVEPYLPHTLLLPRCRLVVSHGGAGIMFGALAHGLPQLILPQGADQFMNAALCARAGVALALAPDEFSAEAVTASGRALDHRAGVRGRRHPSRDRRDAERRRCARSVEHPRSGRVMQVIQGRSGRIGHVEATMTPSGKYDRWKWSAAERARVPTASLMEGIRS